MMIDLCFTWQDVQDRSLNDTVVVVADILRATTVMVTALTQGARAVIPQANETAARALYEKMKSTGAPVLICGERDGLKIPGFDLGNSPREYTSGTVAGHTLIHYTTNGTKALHQVRSAHRVWIAALLNRRAVANALIPSLQQKRDILLVASGKESRFCLEDTVCLGGIADVLMQQDESVPCTDAVMAAQTLFQTHHPFLTHAIQSFSHAKYLTDAGLAADLPVCAELDTSVLVPFLKAGAVIAG